MPDMTNRLPLPLSERLASSTTSIFNRQGREVDVAISGIPFRLATTTDLPYTIETIPVRKDQVDTETDPGEQSLAGWWRRAQRSFHEGAGSLYQEDSASLNEFNGFFDSAGVDVFTKGQLTLLKKMSANPSGLSFTRLRTWTDSGVQGFTAISSGNLYTSQVGDTTAAPNLLHDPTPTLVDGFRVAGNAFYSVASDGTLYSGLVSSPGTATTWPCGATPSRMRFGKSRLWIVGGRKIWQPDLSLSGGSTQNPIFTNPNTGWSYTCIAEGLGAMYFGGHDGNSSSIQAITLTSGTGALPTLSGAAITAALPDGELVQEIEVLAGSIMGIGTSKGFRAATLNADGTLVYGPLLIEPSGVTGCTSMTTSGRFFLVSFATASGNAKAYRVDTGTELDQNVYPYASDADLGSAGNISSMCFADRLVATHSNGSLWYRHSTDYVSSGFLQTGRIRYRTTERKLFRFLSMEIQPLTGQIEADIILEGGSTSAVATLTKQGEVALDRYPINIEPARYVSVKFTLQPQGTTATPTLNSYQVDAYPCVAPQRLITVPLLCFDREKAKSGQWYGGEGFAIDRLSAIQELEKQATTVAFQDFTMGDTGQLVTIERIRFVQTSPGPTRGALSAGAGGILLLELRTAEA